MEKTWREACLDGEVPKERLPMHIVNAKWSGLASEPHQCSVYFDTLDGTPPTTSISVMEGLPLCCQNISRVMISG